MRRRGEQRDDSATLIDMDIKSENNYGSITTVTTVPV